MISTCGGERSGYASTGMRWNEKIPPTVMKAGHHQHQKPLPQCRLDDSMDHSDALMLSLPIEYFLFRASESALQRVRKLQEQTAVSDDLIPGLEPAGHLGLPIQAFTQCYRSPAELVR